MSTRKFAVPVVTDARIAAGIFKQDDDLPLSYFQENGHMYATQPISACIVDNLVEMSQPEDSSFYPTGAKIDLSKPVQLRSVYFRTADGSVVCANVLLTLELDTSPGRDGKVVVANKHHDVMDKKIYVGAVLWDHGHLTFCVHEKPDDWEYLGYSLRYNICSADDSPLI